MHVNIMLRARRSKKKIQETKICILKVSKKHF